ncbi:hypothetical protein BDY24DRAFT_436358 [Mrakia frigida]|uniref:uncharacterized protein n=1 Tax=Mrakia frigida TaxID=29902 RepID=UPI003FCC1FAF
MSAGVGVGAVGASKVEELRGLKKSSVEVEKDEGSTTEEEEEEELVQRAVKKRREESGSGGVKDGESKDQGVECEEVKVCRVSLSSRLQLFSTGSENRSRECLPSSFLRLHRLPLEQSSSPTKSDAYIPPSSSAANPSFSPRTTPTSHSLDELHTEIEPEPESEVEPDPSKPAFLDKLAILSLFQTGPLLPPTSSSSLAELDLLSFDQPSDRLQQPESSVLSTLSHSVGRPPLTDLSLASLLLARTTDHPASSSSSCPFSSSPSSSPLNTKMSEPSQNSSSNSHSSFEHPSPRDASDLKRKAPSTPLPSQPPSKIVKISPPKPSGPGSKMDHDWLGFLTSGWFGDGWRWRKKKEEDDPSSSRDDGSGDVEMEDASSNSSSKEGSS